MKKIVLLIGLFLLFISINSYAVTVDEIIEKLEENQEKIEDITADVVMEISVAGKTTIQEMQMWSKQDKTKIEVEEVKSEKLTPLENDSLTGQEGKSETELPMTVIMDADKMTIKQAGKELQVIDLKEVKDKRKAIPQTPPGLTLQKGMGELLRKSDVTITREEGNEITLSVIPEESNPLMQKLDMVVDMEKGVITQQKMYSNMGMSFCSMEYEKKDEIWVLKKFTMTSNLGQMGISTIKAEYKNVEVNKGIKDKMFK
jgi:outer membrane lipoprotein-sorting protein